MIYTALALFAVGIAALLRLHRLAEFHHLYYGLVLVVLAPVLNWPVMLAWVGVILLIDDDVQHVAQALGLVPRMQDFTPIHKLGAQLMAIDWKSKGMYLPVGIGLALAAAAVFCAAYFGV